MKTDKIVLIITAVLFIVPFFWLKPGFVDLGGDAGRLYFLDPWAITQHLFVEQNVFGASIYAILPYQVVLSVLYSLFRYPQLLINIEHGIQLSFSFISIFLIVKELIKISEKNDYLYTNLIGITSGLVYTGLITKTGWVTSLETFNQVFLNPLVFFLLFRFVLTSKFSYGTAILVITLFQSQNFGFSSMPQLMSFYPLAFLFLYFFTILVLGKPFPWRRICWLLGIFTLLHSFHLIPTIASILDKGSDRNTYIFSKISQENAGLKYFDHNRQTLGKLSLELLQPNNWNAFAIITALIPFISFLGFIYRRSKLLLLLGLFFSITFFLVSANVTLLGVKIYRQLFYIPGFLMFRSFDEKWYYVFVFFYTLIFGVSFSFIGQHGKKLVLYCIACLVTISVLIRVYPFFQGSFYHKFWHQSNNVPVTFDIDSDLLEMLDKIKTLPQNNDALTVPLTLSYMQVSYGKTDGAYIGVSMYRLIGGKNDYPGFWSFDRHQEILIEILKEGDIQKFLQLLSIRNIGYIFRNNDPRIMKEFPKYPYYKHDMTIDIPMIETQQAYEQWLSSIPISKIYEKGFYQIFELDEKIVRPRIYIPDKIYNTPTAVFEGESFRSAYIDKNCEVYDVCGEEQNKSIITFTKESPVHYTFNLNLEGKIKPFLLILSEPYHKTWELNIDAHSYGQPILANGYANAWVIDPSKLSTNVTGSIQLGFQRYFFMGRILTGVGVFLLISTIIYVYKKHK